jgi:hypothetical protein
MKISKILLKKLLSEFSNKMDFALKSNGFADWVKLRRLPDINIEDNIFLNNDILEIYNQSGGFRLRIPNDKETLFNYSVEFYNKNKYKLQRRKINLRRATRKKPPK